MAYKVIYRVDTTPRSAQPITWEAGCPLAFEALQVSRDVDSGTAFLQVRVRNVCSELVGSFRATFTVTFEDGSTETLEAHPLDADIAVGDTYDLTPFRLSRGDVETAAGKVLGARSRLGTWTSTADATTLPELPKLSGLTEAQMQERVLSLRELDADITPGDEEEHGVYRDSRWWRCVCGQVNVDRTSCCTCRANLGDLVELEDPQTLDKRAEERKANGGELATPATKQDGNRQAAETAEKPTKPRWKLPAIIGAAVLVIAIVAVAVLNLLSSPVWLISKATYHDEGGEKTETTYTYDDEGVLSETDDGDSPRYYSTLSDGIGMPSDVFDYGGTKPSQSNKITKEDSDGQPLAVTRTTYADDEDDEDTVTYRSYTYRSKGHMASDRMEYEDYDTYFETTYDEGGLPSRYTSYIDLGSYFSPSKTVHEYEYEKDGDHVKKITEHETSYEDDEVDDESTTVYDVEYDSDGNVSKITNTDTGAYAEFTYTKIDKPCLWAQIQANLFVQDLALP